MNPDDDLNLQTARIPWTELQRHFARGAVLKVAHTVDLIEVASAFRDNDVIAVRAWRDCELLVAPSDEEAKAWFESRAALWAVVVAPWVLVQESRE